MTRHRNQLPSRERIQRARRISTDFGRIYLGIKARQWMARHLDPPDMEERWSRFHRKSANSLFESAVELKGMILKGCQFHGSRPDIAPPEYVEILSKLQDRVPPRPFPEMRSVVEEELGESLEDLFSEFSEHPVAAASLAQVYQARLKNGRRVAVKVQYPEIGHLVASDLSNLRALFRAVGLIERNMDLKPIIEEFADHFPRELDFMNEASNSERIAKIFQHRPDIYIPGIDWRSTTTRVLVSDFVDGIKISDREALESAGIACEDVMRILVEAYCEQILVHGFFHADPHPGNLMVLPADDMGNPLRVVFIDFGLAKQLPPGFRNSMVHFATALLTGESERMGDALIELGFESQRDSRDSLRAISAILLKIARRLRHQTYVDPDLIRQAGEDLPRLIRENPIVQIPGHIVLLGRVVALLSGLGNTLGVRLDMLKTILPYALDPRPGQSRWEQGP